MATNRSRAAGDAALARHHIYALLSRLYLEGLSAPLLPHVRAIPELAEAVPISFSPDVAAADHYHLFGFNLFPYESIFLDESGLLAGSVTAAVASTYRDAGFLTDTESHAADHIGHELRFLAVLCQEEAQAWDGDDRARANRLRQLQQSFLQAHLLRWLLPFIIALQRQKEPFYVALAELSLVVVADHTAALPGQTDPVIFPSSAPESQPPDGNRALKALAGLLCAPPRSGIYLSRDTIAALAQQMQLPHGFGSRYEMLLALLQAADRYDRLSDLRQRLHNELTGWQEAYQRYANQAPLVKAYATVWEERVLATVGYLGQIGPT